MHHFASPSLLFAITFSLSLPLLLCYRILLCMAISYGIRYMYVCYLRIQWKSVFCLPNSKHSFKFALITQFHIQIEINVTVNIYFERKANGNGISRRYRLLNMYRNRYTTAIIWALNFSLKWNLNLVGIICSKHLLFDLIV